MPSIPTAATDICVRPASQIQPKPIRWLWDFHLALGTLTMLDGDPGLGKSFFALDLCARLSTGRPFADGTPSHGPANSLVLECEDDDERTFRPRLDTLGTDVERVFSIPQEHPRTGDLLRFPSDFDILLAHVVKTNARVVVIDPITAFLESGVNVSSDTSVRRALYPLAKLAEVYQFVVILLRHLNKIVGGPSLYRGAGSIAFNGMSRTAWLVGRDPAEPKFRRVLAQHKNNLAPIQPSLAFEMRETADGPRLQWLGKSDLTSDQLVAKPRKSTPNPARGQARDFLKRFLADGPRTSRDVWVAVEAEGIAERTLQRAMGELNVQTVRTWPDRRQVCYWTLPGQQLPPEVAAKDEESDLEPWLAPLREKYPPSTPLDDW